MLHHENSNDILTAMVRRTLRAIRKRLRAHKLPKLLLMNNVQLKTKHLDDILEENEIERSWYKTKPAFKDRRQILAAAKVGKLVLVRGNKNYLPIMRYRNPKLIDNYPAYLTPAARGLLDEIGKEWRRRMNAADVDSNINLAITSLLRTESYQQLIVQSGKLADPESAHTRGEAFDIDASSYYIGETPVNARADRQQEFHKAFEEMGAALTKQKYADYSTYKPAVHVILHNVISEMMIAGKLHFAHEYPGTTNAVFHVCRNPKYSGTGKI